MLPLVCVIEGVFWLCPLLLVCIPLPCLKAPKRWFRRELGCGEASAHPECKGKGILRRNCQATRAQIQSQEEAKHFKEHVPLEIRLEVNKVVIEVWEEVKLMLKECLHEELANWVLDPGTMESRASTYDHLLMIYWVTTHLVGHSSGGKRS